MSPFLYACSEGHLEIVQWLVAIGGSLFARNDNGNNGLHLACGAGAIELVNWLLVRGLDVNARNKAGLTPFHFASDAGHVELANFLGATGASLWMEPEVDSATRTRIDEDNEMFLRACEAEEEKLHVASLKETQNRNTEASTNDDDKNSVTSGDGPLDSQLRDACAKGDEDTVVKLLKSGAKPNSKNSNGSSPLHFACAIGHRSYLSLHTLAYYVCNVLLYIET